MVSFWGSGKNINLGVEKHYPTITPLKFCFVFSTRIRFNQGIRDIYNHWKVVEEIVSKGQAPLISAAWKNKMGACRMEPRELGSSHCPMANPYCCTFPFIFIFYTLLVNTSQRFFNSNIKRGLDFFIICQS